MSEAIQFKAKCLTTTSESKSRGYYFIAQLESFLQLNVAFKDFLSQLRDFFQVHHVNFSHSASLSHFKKVSVSSTKKAKSNAAEESSAVSNRCQSGISLHNIDKILLGMMEFTTHVSNILEVISTLSQFTRLNLEQKLKGLPRFAGLWLLKFLEESDDKDEEEESIGEKFYQSEVASIQIGTLANDGTGSASDITLATPDYLDMLIGKTTVYQKQPMAGMMNSLHSEALIFTEENLVEVTMETEEEADHTEGSL